MTGNLGFGLLPRLPQRLSIEGVEQRRDDQQDSFVKRAWDRQKADGGEPAERLRDAAVPSEDAYGANRSTGTIEHRTAKLQWRCDGRETRQGRYSEPAGGRPTQVTPAGQKIGLPKRKDVMAALRKVAKADKS